MSNGNFWADDPKVMVHVIGKEAKSKSFRYDVFHIFVG